MSTVEIKNRFSGAVLFSLEISEETAALSWSFRLGHAVKAAIAVKANLREADLREADLNDANLRGANLREADLSEANLSGANLRGANLSGADLSEANLSGANLRGANLRWAALRGADLSEAHLSGVPVIPALDTKILAAIEAGGGLDMSSWHTCETTHCRAGWAITMAGEEGRSFEQKIGPAAAGALIYGASYPSLPVPNFYATNDEAMEDMKARAAQDGVS